jgi:hypothetical protein
MNEYNATSDDLQNRWRIKETRNIQKGDEEAYPMR